MANTTLTDTTGQLPQVGSDLGSFLTNLTPGVVGFVFILAIIGGILAIIGGIVFAIVTAVKAIKMKASK